ncbi:MAG: hypothetical protein M3214_01475 [Actinomycetota bacterium]|nr:hypothetical protein [Actinomycetota bacterium]
MQPDIRIEMGRQHVDELIRDADRYRLAASIRRSHTEAIIRKSSWPRRLFDRPAIAR